MEVADELGWAFVNITLRPFYAEGSKTLAFEIAERLGWRLPDVVVAPIASGSMFTKVAKGFEELVKVGLVEPKAVKFIGGQAAGCAPVATALARAATRSGRSNARRRSSAHWRSAARPTAATRSSWPARPADRSSPSTDDVDRRRDPSRRRASRGSSPRPPAG